MFDLMCAAIHFVAVMLKMSTMGLIKVYLLFNRTVQKKIIWERRKVFVCTCICVQALPIVRVFV